MIYQEHLPPNVVTDAISELKDQDRIQPPAASDCTKVTINEEQNQIQIIDRIDKEDKLNLWYTKKQMKQMRESRRDETDDTDTSSDEAKDDSDNEELDDDTEEDLYAASNLEDATKHDSIRDNDDDLDDVQYDPNDAWHMKTYELQVWCHP